MEEEEQAVVAVEAAANVQHGFYEGAADGAYGCDA